MLASLWACAAPDDHDTSAPSPPRADGETHDVARSRETDDPNVLRIRAGDVSAFEEIYAQYHRPLRTFVHDYVDDWDVASEITSDLFLNLWRIRATWRPSRGIATYLFAAARNRARNYFRDRRALRLRDARLADEARDERYFALSSRTAAADVVVEHADTLAHVWTAIKRLPETQRSALILRWTQQLTYEQIASVLGVTPMAAQKQVSRALQRLREQLGG